MWIFIKKTGNLGKMSKTKYIFGNWKMNITVSETKDFIEQLLSLVQTTSNKVAIFPPFTSIAASINALKQSKLSVGAQNVSEHTEGSYTGEVSAEMLKDLGVKYVIIGHSERRSLFHEDDKVVNLKVKKALDAQLSPLICIGETLEEKNSGKTKNVLTHQISEALLNLSEDEIKKVFVVYEPVWAIGSGRISSPEDTEEIHKYCRNYISECWTIETANTIPFLYGGSVKPENVVDITLQPNVDGVLIGRASIEIKLFNEIIKNLEA